MNNDFILKIAAKELQETDIKNVVKVAGFVRRFKNWLKQRTDPQYKDAVENLHKDTAEIKNSLSELYKELDILQAAIKDGELSEYKISFEKVKDLSAKLWENLKQTSKDNKDYYNIQEMSIPGFNDWFKKYLPKDYGIELGTIYNKPLKDFKWYSQISPQQIYIRDEGALKYFLLELNRVLIRKKAGTQEEIDQILSNKDQIIELLKNAIVDGIFISSDMKKPSKDIPNHLAGTTEIEITTAPFILPNSNIQIQAKAVLIDLSTSKSSRNKLSLKKIHYVDATILNKPIESKTIVKDIIPKEQEALQTVAFLTQNQVPIQYTQLNEIEFAKILQKGYQKIFGENPNAETLAFGWAQGILESGRPVKLPNNNIGNIKANDSWIKSGKPYFTKKTYEFSSKGERFSQPDAVWRSHATPEDGAADYWRLLSNKYGSALKWASSGDPTSASVALGLSSYYTASIQKYSAGVSQLYKEFMNKIAPNLSNLISLPKLPPGEKPIVKKWKDDYTETEKSATLLKDDKLQQPSDNSIMSLIKNLLSSSGQIENFVKEAIIKQILPKSTILLSIIGNTQIEEKIEFAKKTSFILNKFLQTTTEIYSDNNNIQIQASIYGSPLIATKSIQAVCDCMSDQLLKKQNIKIEAMVIPCYLSKLAILPVKDLYKSSRKLYLKKIGNNVAA